MSVLKTEIEFSLVEGGELTSEVPKNLNRRPPRYSIKQKLHKREEVVL